MCDRHDNRSTRENRRRMAQRRIEQHHDETQPVRYSPSLRARYSYAVRAAIRRWAAIGWAHTKANWDSMKALPKGEPCIIRVGYDRKGKTRLIELGSMRRREIPSSGTGRPMFFGQEWVSHKIYFLEIQENGEWIRTK